MLRLIGSYYHFHRTIPQDLKIGLAVSAKEKEMLQGEANRLAAMIVDIRRNQTLAQQAGNLPASSSAPLEGGGRRRKAVPVKPSSPRLSRDGGKIHL